MAPIPLNDPAIAALSSLLGTDLVTVSRGGTEIARITVANLWTDVPLTGTPTAPTPPKNNSSTRVATTSYVKTNLADYGRLDTVNNWLSGQIVGTGVGSAGMSILGAAGSIRSLSFGNGTGVSDFRALIGLSTAAEAGSDAGSDVILWTGTDAGTPSVAIEVRRDTTEAIRFHRGLDLLGGGPLFVTNVQVVQDRQTGWGTPTGTMTRTAFDGSGATLADTRAALAALLNDLFSHGLIGA